MYSAFVHCSRREPGFFTLIGDKAPSTARDGSEVARALNRRDLHTGNDDL